MSKIIVNIYFLSDPRNPEEIRYIGRTKNSLEIRLGQHISKSKSPDKYKGHNLSWIRKIRQEGFEPLITLLEQVEGWKESHLRERELIRNFKNLNNHADGGAGPLNNNISKETRKKLSIAKKKFYRETNKKFHNKQVYIFSRKGNYIEFFQSYNDCVKKTSISRKLIRKYINSGKLIKGYYLSSKNIIDFKLEISDKNVNFVLDKEGEHIFCKNVKEAALIIGCHISAVYMLISEKRNSVFNYKILN